MSIMVAGRWDAPHSPQVSDAPQQPLNASAPQRLPVTGSSFIRRCEECDRGILSRKTAYRLSAPFVVIGLLLLIPSFLGILSCASMLFGINADIISSESAQSRQTTADATFRSDCARDVRRSVLAGGQEPSQVLTEEYCECALATFKETKSEKLAAKECGVGAQAGTLGAPAQEVHVLYAADDVDGTKSTAGPQLLLGSVSSALIVGLGISFFVAGLLGWLLIRKKHVLHCSACDAVVNAS